MMEQERKKGGERLTKKESASRTKKEKIRLTILLALVIFLAVIVTVFALYRGWAKAPDIPVEQPPVQTGPEKEPSGGEEIIEDVEIVSDRKKDFYTFLVVGRDTGGGGNTDTILLAAYDIANQNLNVMSIPRDTMVNIPYDIKRINAVYNYAGGGDKGIQALYEEVSQLVGFVPDYKVVMEWNAIGDLVDAIGGVWFDVPRDMNYDDPDQDLHIHVGKGYQLLDGESAMGVIRWRENNDGTGYVTGDIGRIETQQAFLKVVVSQCLRVSNVTRIRELAQVFSDNVQTDLTLGNLVWFAEQAVFGGLTVENVNFMTLPGNYFAEAWSRYYQCMQSYVLPDAKQLLAAVNQGFNPYREDRVQQGLDIMSVNPDGSLSSTTGAVEDEKAALPPVIPTPEPTPEPTSEPTPAPEQSAPPESPEPSSEPSETPETEQPDEETPNEETPNEDTPDEEAPGEEAPGEDTPEQDPEPTEEIPILPPMQSAEESDE